MSRILYLLSYFSKDDWMPLLSMVSDRLEVKGVMKLDMELVKFLNSKRKLESMKDEVAILEVFDSITPEIEKIYDKKLEERDWDDEFGIDDLCSGVKTEDGMFFVRFALPSIIYNIYEKWLKGNLEKEAMFEELFTIGSGSMTHTYFPEVLPFCDECPELFLQESELQSMNLKSFRSQSSNNFSQSYKFMDLLDPDTDDDEMTKSGVGSDEEDISSDKLSPVDDDDFSSVLCPADHEEDNSSDYFPTDETNPFASDSEEDVETVDLKSCDHCCELFPSEDFVKLHERIFHYRVVKARFVEDGEDLITSFMDDKGGSSPEVMQSDNDVGLTSNDGENKEVEDRTKKSKYKLRKSLK